MPGILVALVVAAAVQNATLGSEIARRNLPVPPAAADLDQPITSYSVLDDDGGFVIAYYGVEPDGQLHELRVRAFDARSRTWRMKQFPEPIGAVLSVQRHGGYLYLKGHSSPSATPMLVLTERLERKRELDGWPMLMLDDGRVVFQRSMVHFAPAHAGVLAVYDPKVNRESNLYPPTTVGNARGIERVRGSRHLLVDRSFSDVKKGNTPATIDFISTVQLMRLDSGQAVEPAGPARRVSVTCDVSAPKSMCRERSARRD
jgi:hypothetical protein